MDLESWNLIVPRPTAYLYGDVNKNGRAVGDKHLSIEQKLNDQIIILMSITFNRTKLGTVVMCRI